MIGHVSDRTRLDNPRILVGDDDAAIRGFVADALRYEGYDVATAANGREALRLLTGSGPSPSLILLDMRMPVMDGWTFARLLRADRVQIPIVVMTAARDARISAREIHADDCLPKPFEIAELFGMVERFSPVPPK